jgi:3-isopropylmalate dehydratase small subunit
MNAYNIFDENHYSTILYHAIAESEQQVKELAEEKGIDISSLTIELERANVKPEFGRQYAPKIEDCIVK